MLFEALNAGGDSVKNALHALRNHELYLFNDLGGETMDYIDGNQNTQLR